MCGRRNNSDSIDSQLQQPQNNSNNNNYPFPNDELDKYVESFDKVLSNIGSITNAIVDVSMDAGRELNDKAKQWSYNWLFNNNTNNNSKDEFENFINEAYNDVYEYNKDDQKKQNYKFPPFYQTRDSGFDKNSSIGSSFKEFFENSPFLQNAHLKFGATPFGYRSYKGPSIRQYHDCLDKQGKTVWDDQGYWRCLFPESTVPVDLLKFKSNYFKDSIITKEDFMNEMQKLGENEKNSVIDLKSNGKFFNKYEDYLDWKKDQFVEYKKKKQIKQEEARQARAKLIEESQQKQLQNKNTTKDNSIVSKFITSSSIKSNMFTDSETNEIKLIENKKECYNDGNCIFTKITKSKPIGSRDWVNVEEHVENSNTNVSSNDNGVNGLSNGQNNKGWFWK
ncbi:hypothetical protein KGF54_004220 [Candida jiufengensis]|uniref:uncharacterized protein n=1 Tax=Candida jiufengensis TaxID=497108 RepID=UPI002224D018|nr:uncharacterized protein KGF54_004220 [Candida jiufengensis]KAI5951146.1 hypothetical protein KGF54_004220 [Candida jiufengensis]